MPAEILSQSYSDNCLSRLRAHLNDLDAGAAAVTDVKFLVLGNGSAGKTQLRRRLRGDPFQPDWDSTHGIAVTSAPMPMPGDEDVKLNIWDFGGQDIYHGTHALFVRTNAVFTLVWATDTENDKEYEHQGITFRNYPLHYWVTYVRHLADGESPVAIVQTKCDTVADEAWRAPVPDKALDGLGFCREVHYSAANDRGREGLEAVLRQAIAELRNSQGVNLIGKGRLKVQRRIEALRNDNGTLPEEWRTLDRATFDEWCAEAGGVSEPEHLLSYLHNAGILFYQKDLFDGQIILDHAWALNAIYAVFDRTNSYTRLRDAQGRFKRAHLEDLVWADHSVKEQRLFLGMMKSCGICFVHRPGPEGREEDETEYIAPDLLPERETVQTVLADRWRFEIPAEETVTYEYKLLHRGLMRGVIARIGAEAGYDALYWSGGVYVYEETTRSRALIEQEIADGEWHGTVRLATKDGQSAQLAARLSDWIEEENQRMGLSPKIARSSPVAVRAPVRETGTENEEMPALKFGREPAKYCVSYAWGDDTPDGKAREAYIDKLCEEAIARDERVLRDKNYMAFGDSITDFMHQLAAGQRIFVFLSEKYLQSPFCTFELYQIWLNCRAKDDEFAKRVRVFVLPGVGLKLKDRIAYHDWWQQEYEEMQKDVEGLTSKGYLRHLPPKDFERFRVMGQFSGDVMEILGTVEDRLRPREWEDFVKYGFDDPPDGV